MSRQYFRVRFGLRTLLVLMALVCFAFWAIPAVLDWAKWRYLRASITQNMAEFADAPGTPMVYAGLVRQNEFFLSNHELKWDASIGGMVDKHDTPLRSDAAFVIMPGKTGRWLNSPSEVMRYLKNNVAGDQAVAAGAK